MLFALAFLACALPARALAATTVDLREHPTSHGRSIVLGDLFEGVEAKTPVGPAAAAGGEAVLSATVVQTAAREAGLDWSNPRGLRRIIVSSVGGDALPSRPGALRPAHPRRSQQTLTYARNIQAGDIISAADLVWSDDAVASADSLGDPDAATGKAARRALRAGAPASARDLLAPRVVKRDETVQVSFEADGIALTLDGKAMSDGSVGETVQVMNLASKRIVEAVVSGPGRAVVGPRADALKAQPFQPASLQTASLR